MAMTETFIDEVKRRSLTERDRKDYPGGFPGLPVVPAARYTDTDFARLEQEGVFGRSWLMVAHADALRNPGDYHLSDQPPHQIMLVRGQHGVIHAPHHTCKPRGAPPPEQPHRQHT